MTGLLAGGLSLAAAVTALLSAARLARRRYRDWLRLGAWALALTAVGATVDREWVLSGGYGVAAGLTVLAGRLTGRRQ